MIKHVKSFSYTILLLVGLVLIVPQSVLAVPIIKLESNGNSVTIEDGDDGSGVNHGVDSTGAGDNTILFIGALGNFNIVVSQGIDASVGSVPALSFFTTAQTLPNVGGSLTAMFTVTDFVGPLPSSDVGIFNSNVFGGAMGPVTYEAFLDSNNQAFGLTTQLTNFGGPFSGAFSSSDSTPAPAVSGPYSLTMVFNITHTAEQVLKTTGVTSQLTSAVDPNGQPIPEPSTVLLFGGGLLGVGFWRWKKAMSGKIV